MTTASFDYLADLSAFNAEVTAKLAGAPQALGSTTDGAQSFLIVQGASGGGLDLSIHVNAPGTGFMQLNADGSIKKIFPP